VHQVELSVAGALVAPLADISAVLAEAHHARIHVAVGDVEIAVGRKATLVGRLKASRLSLLPGLPSWPTTISTRPSGVYLRTTCPVTSTPHTLPSGRCGCVRLPDTALAPGAQELAVAVELGHRMGAPAEDPHMILLVHGNCRAGAEGPSWEVWASPPPPYRASAVRISARPPAPWRPEQAEGDEYLHASYQVKRPANCIWRGAPNWLVNWPKLDGEVRDVLDEFGSNRMVLVRLKVSQRIWNFWCSDHGIVKVLLTPVSMLKMPEPRKVLRLSGLAGHGLAVGGEGGCWIGPQIGSAGHARLGPRRILIVGDGLTRLPVGCAMASSSQSVGQRWPLMVLVGKRRSAGRRR